MDAAHKWTDEQLEALERRMQAEYSQAAREMRAKQEKALAKYARELEQRERALDTTKEARAAHEAWLRGKAADQAWMQGMVDDLTRSATNANQKAVAMLNDALPIVYAENANRAAFAIDKAIGMDTSFVLADESTIRHLMGLGESNGQLIHEVTMGPVLPRDPETMRQLQSLRKDMDAVKDWNWNRQKFTSAITQGVLQGESIPNITKRVQSVVNMDANSARRAARTATTAAENAGRVSSYRRADRMGIPLLQEWMATPDDRTRPSHRDADGQQVEVGEFFDVGGAKMEYPGDPAGGDESWNCRCTLRGRVSKFDKRGGERWARLDDDVTYEEWKSSKPIYGQAAYAAGRVMPSEWWAMPQAAVQTGYADAATIAAMEANAAALEAEVERLARSSLPWVQSEESIKDLQRYVDKYAAQMAENAWAAEFNQVALQAESMRLYDEQAAVYDRYTALRAERRDLADKAFGGDAAAMARLEKVEAEAQKVFAEYEAYFAKVDEVDRKIDALRSYARAEEAHARWSEELAQRLAERETALAARAENERLLAEARLARNRAYGELSEAQPFAPHVRAVLGDAYADTLEAMVTAAEAEHPEIAACYRRFSSQMRVIDHEKKDGAFYKWSDRGIHFGAEDAARGTGYYSHQEPYQVVFHEFGHLIDHVGGYGRLRYASQFEELGEIIKKDWTKYRNAEGKRLGVTRGKNRAAINALLEQGARFDKKKYGNVSDIIEGCTRESYPLGVGHGTSYHSTPGATGKEFFAEVFDAAMSNQASYNEMKRIFPNAVAKVEEIAKEMCG